MTRFFIRMGVVVMVMMTVTTTPASADPARPGNTESVVLTVSPQVADLVVEVTGGDSFLRVVAPPGAVIEVPGYRDEPYIRFDADGSVFENRNSPAHWLNNDRFGLTPVPDSATPESAPDWHRVAGGGDFAWHDHRIHWMSPDLPASVDGSGPALVQEWSVPLLVDGQEVVASGDLTWHPSVSPLPWVALVALAAAAGWLVARRSVASTGAVVAVAGLLAVVSSVAQASITPPGAGGELVSEGAAITGVLLGAITLFVGRRITSVGDLPALVGAVVLVMWCVQRIGTLWMPILPTPLPAALERLLVAVVLGAVLGTGLAILQRRLAPPAVARPREA